MLNAHTKFEMSTIACNEEMEGNAKCKNSRFEPPFGGRLFSPVVHLSSMLHCLLVETRIWSWNTKSIFSWQIHRRVVILLVFNNCAKVC